MFSGGITEKDQTQKIGYQEKQQSDVSNVIIVNFEQFSDLRTTIRFLEYNQNDLLPIILKKT